MVSNRYETIGTVKRNHERTSDNSTQSSLSESEKRGLEGILDAVTQENPNLAEYHKDFERVVIDLQDINHGAFHILSQIFRSYNEISAHRQHLERPLVNSEPNYIIPSSSDQDTEDNFAKALDYQIEAIKREWSKEGTLNINDLCDKISKMSSHLYYVYRQRDSDTSSVTTHVKTLQATEQDIDPTFVNDCFATLANKLTENATREPVRLYRFYNIIKGYENHLIPVELLSEQWDTKNPERASASAVSWINKMFKKFNIGLEIEHVSGYRLRIASS